MWCNWTLGRRLALISISLLAVADVELWIGRTLVQVFLFALLGIMMMMMMLNAVYKSPHFPVVLSVSPNSCTLRQKAPYNPRKRSTLCRRCLCFGNWRRAYANNNHSCRLSISKHIKWTWMLLPATFLKSLFLLVQKRLVYSAWNTSCLGIRFNAPWQGSHMAAHEKKKVKISRQPSSQVPARASNKNSIFFFLFTTPRAWQILFWTLLPLPRWRPGMGCYAREGGLASKKEINDTCGEDHSEAKKDA